MELAIKFYTLSLQVTQSLSSGTKLRHKTQAQDSSTNGGDASRIGEKKVRTYLVEFEMLISFTSPTRGRVAPISA